MPLYLLTPTPEHAAPAGPVDSEAEPFVPSYSACTCMVVMAPDEATARQTAHDSDHKGNEDTKRPGVWLEPDFVQCEEVVENGESVVICSDFFGLG